MPAERVELEWEREWERVWERVWEGERVGESVWLRCRLASLVGL